MAIKDLGYQLRRLAMVGGLLCFFAGVFAQQTPLADQVNVFLGTQGDHGQLSPAASFPFSMLDIGPETYPKTHTGYEHRARLFLGFTHGRLEGVGCRGSGGNLLIKPFLGTVPATCDLIKKQEAGSPGYYAVSFKDGIATAFTLKERSAVERYHFPPGLHGLFFDLAHVLNNGFIAEQHQTGVNELSGWIESNATCHNGAFRLYYYLRFDQPVTFSDSGMHTLTVMTNSPDVTVRLALSSISVAYAKAAITKEPFGQVRKESAISWNSELARIGVGGDAQEARLFYSLLYRAQQAPFDITEPDGTYHGSDGVIRRTSTKAYNGWTIWDNYKTTFPLLSIIQPEKYQDMVTSVASLYLADIRSRATATEPSNTVRKEHSIVVLLDAYRKGYRVDFQSILDPLRRETDSLDFSKPDKALESSYDTWAMAQILHIVHQDSLSRIYLDKAARWTVYWNKDFKDLDKPDVDRFSARKMYQGTIWQYRWFAPFDQKGLIAQCGGEAAYLKQLDEFFDKDYYSATNEPDIQVPYMYQGTTEPWRSQEMIRKYAQDTVVQFYYDDNERGVNPTIDRVYNNRPDAFVLSMDEDMGAMSSWYLLAACGLSPACVGYPVYYLHVPMFQTVVIGKLSIGVSNFSAGNRYIRSVTLNGKVLDRNWLTQEEIMRGGVLRIAASERPEKQFGINNPFITAMEMQWPDAAQ